MEDLMQSQRRDDSQVLRTKRTQAAAGDAFLPSGSMFLTAVGIAACSYSRHRWRRLLALLLGCASWSSSVLATYTRCKRFHSPELGYQLLTTNVTNAFYSLPLTLFIWAIQRQRLPALVTFVSLGPAVNWEAFQWNKRRAKSNSISLFGLFMIRIVRDPPLLLVSYLIDSHFGRLFKLPAWPYFHDGHGALISDIDACVSMGGRPLARHVEELVAHGTHSVVNMAAEWPGPVAAYSASGIEQLRLPTVDNSAPSLSDLKPGVDFVRRRLANHGGSGRVYVHCKGGRGRAAAMVLCCLVGLRGMTLEEAFLLMKEKRPVVEEAILSYDSVVEFAGECSGDSHATNE